MTLIKLKKKKNLKPYISFDIDSTIVKSIMFIKMNTHEFQRFVLILLLLLLLLLLFCL